MNLSFDSCVEALEREVHRGVRFLPRAAPAGLKVAFVVSSPTAEPERRRNEDFVASIAKALDLPRSAYTLCAPMEIPEAKLWIFFGELPVGEIRAEQIVTTEAIAKLVDSTALKRDLWKKLKSLKDLLH